MWKEVLIAPTIDKYTTNDLILGYASDYFHLCGKDLQEIVK